MIMDFFDQTGTESGWSMQESGYDGFSSDLKHQWGEYLPCESSVPVEAVGSFVKPIPKEEQYVWYYFSEMPAPPIEESTTGYDTPTLSLSAPKEGLSLVELRHHQCHPIENAIEAPPTIVSANENEAMPLSKGDHEDFEQGRACNIMGLAEEMTNGQNEKRRRSKPRRRHVMDKYWKLFLPLVLASGCLPMSLAQEGAVGLPKDAQTAKWQNSTCFPCMDVTCQHLKTVYGPGDTKAYERSHNKTFSECPTISFPSNRSCNVCLLGQDVIIICSKPFQWLDVEGDTSKLIYPKACPTMETTQNSDNTFTTQGKPFLTVDTETLDSDNSTSVNPRLKRVHFIPLGIGITAVTAIIVFMLVYYCCCIKKESTNSVV